MDAEPCGPIDPPLLEASAPDSWWNDKSKELFNAASYITDILYELEELGHPLLTPFAGFCAFSAAAKNLYVAAFPKMNLGRCTEAETLAERNILYLNKFRKLWKLGEGWVSINPPVNDTFMQI